MKLPFSRICQLVCLTGLLTAVFLAYGDRVDDLDLWWHLKSGELIAQTHQVPSQDRFAYTTDLPATLARLGLDEMPAAQRPSAFAHWSMNLNHSWLGQLLFYQAYAAGGLTGVALLKSLLFALTLLILYLTMRRAGAGSPAALLTLALIAWIAKDFNYSRPQLFSFVGLALLGYLLTDFRQGGRKFLGLPLLMLLWANLHGGFIIGVAVLLLFAIGEIPRLLLAKKWPWPPAPLSGRRLAALLLITGVTLLAALANPNGYRIFLFPDAVRHSLFQLFIEEYHRPMAYEYHAYWLMLLLVALVLPFRLKRLELAEIFVALFLMASSYTAIRAIIFFAIGSGGVLARSLSEAATWLATRAWFSRLAPAPFRRALDLGFNALLALLALALVGKTALGNEPFNLAAHGQDYPEEAVRFIEANNLPGPLFNPYNWGGYLIWTLPSHPVFIDGRCLNETAYAQYLQIVGAAKGQEKKGPLWRRLLDAHRVQLIMSPAVAGNGNLIALVDRLFFAPDWEVIYQDGKTLLFLRKTEENAAIIQRYALPKQAIFQEAEAECRQGIEKTPATWGYYETLGYICMNSYRLDEAKAMFREYLTRNPYNERIRRTLTMLEQLPAPAGRR